MEKIIINVNVLGLGYIGLPTAVLIASKGVKVVGVDIDKEIIETVNQGTTHIVEPDLLGLLKHVIENNMLIAKSNPENADIYVITVQTPVDKDKKPDISYVESAVKMIIPYLRKEALVIIESTIPVGTTEKMFNYILSERPELKDSIYIAHCPERVLPGKIIYELEHNDRIIGGINEQSTRKAIDFYALFTKGNLHPTKLKTAEMCKLVENAYRDVNIAFANEISIIADKLGIDIKEIISLANKHPRVNILQPGPGVGGHCIPIDPWFLIDTCGEESKIMKMAREVNEDKKLWVLKKIKEKAAEIEQKKKSRISIAYLGLSYKPDTDDLRESPSLEIAEKLIDEGYNLLLVEPNIKKYENHKIYDADYAVSRADLIVLSVAHKQFKNIELHNKEILDFCGAANR